MNTGVFAWQLLIMVELLPHNNAMVFMFYLGLNTLEKGYDLKFLLWCIENFLKNYLNKL